MKQVSILLIGFIIVLQLSAQEHLLNANVHFKDNTAIEGNMFLYESEPDFITVENNSGEKNRYPLRSVDYIENQVTILRNFQYESTYKLLEALVESEKMSLYKKNSNETDLFYVVKSGEIYLLEGGKKTVIIDSKDYTADNYGYRGVLKALTRDDPSLSQKIDKVTYHQKELMDVVISYNNGKISYIKTGSLSKKNKKPNWLIYAQYSNNVSNGFFTMNNITPQFFQAGVKLYLTEISRHSFKFGFEYGVYTDIYDSDTNTNTLFSIAVTYQLDFFRTRRSNFYINIRIADLAYIKSSNSSDAMIRPVPRISPGFGYEYRIQDFFLFAELNNILLFKKIPYNFSVGIAYDL